MSNTGSEIKPEAVREIDFDDIGATFAAFGPAFLRVVRILTVDNGTDADMYLTLNGVTDQLRVRAGQAKVYDLKTDDLYINPGDVISIRYKTAPTSGDVFIESITA